MTREEYRTWLIDNYNTNIADMVLCLQIPLQIAVEIDKNEQK